MKIKVKKGWLSDGTIVIFVSDHEDIVPQVRDPHGHIVHYSNTYHILPMLRARVIDTVHLPRATPKAEVKMVMKSLKMAHEARLLGAL
jgi:hypothetical protein